MAGRKRAAGQKRTARPQAPPAVSEATTPPQPQPTPADSEPCKRTTTGQDHPAPPVSDEATPQGPQPDAGGVSTADTPEALAAPVSDAEPQADASTEEHQPQPDPNRTKPDQTGGTTPTPAKTEKGSVTPTVDGAAGHGKTDAPTRARRGRRWEQVRRSARAQGLTRAAAIAHANKVCAEEYPQFAAEYPPPPAVEPVSPDPVPDPPVVEVPEPHEPPEPTPAEPAPAGVSGLGSVPDGWPDLPSNASLAAEIQWVQSSRIDVVEELPGGAVRVDLSRADKPAPSKAAIGWLETAIRFPAKFTDVAVKAASGAEDEQAHVRREKLAIGEVRDLLAEMLDDSD